jgi:hypothetical protein
MRRLQQLEGKHIFTIINSQKYGRRKYSGKCVEVTDLGNGFMLLGIIDRFGKFVAFSSNEIEVIEEEYSTVDEKRKNKEEQNEDATATNG